jgi:hypothetical protein
MCESKVRLTCRLNLQHAIVTHVIPRERGTWPKEAVFTSLFFAVLFNFGCTRHCACVLDIRQFFFIFYFLPSGLPSYPFTYPSLDPRGNPVNVAISADDRHVVSLSTDSSSSSIKV